MSLEVVLLFSLIIVLAGVNAVLKAPRRRARYAGPSRRFIRAERRPTSWEGPSPAQLLDAVRKPDDLLPLKWWQFEHVVGELIARLGYENVIVLNSSSRDGGVDIKATWHLQPVVVQVKHLRPQEFASIDSVRAFAHVTQRIGAAAGYFVTTGQFGTTATVEASGTQPPVHLVDGQALWRWVEQTHGAASTGVSFADPEPVALGGPTHREASRLPPVLKLAGLATLALFLGVCAFASLATAIAPRSASGGSNVVAGTSVQEAKRAAKSYWDRNEQAWIAGDSGALPGLYAGPGLERAKVDLAMKTGNHPDRYARPFRSAIVYLPESPGSQRWFLAQITFTAVNQDGVGLGASGQPVFALFVLDQGLWKVYARDFPVPALPNQGVVFGSLPDHYTLPAPKPSAGYVADASTIEQELVDYENALGRGQKPDGPFPTTYGNYPDAAVRVPIYPAGSGSGTSSFELMGDGFRYTGADGSQVVLFTVKRSTAVSPAKPGACLTQPSAASLSYIYTVSDLVPPGNYAQLSSVQLSTLAVSVPKRSSDTTAGRQLVSVAGAGRDVSYQAAKGSCK